MVAAKLLLLALVACAAASTVHAEEDARELGYSYTSGDLMVGPAEVQHAEETATERDDLAREASFVDLELDDALAKKKIPHKINYLRDGMANEVCTKCQLGEFKSCYRERAKYGERKARSPGVCEGRVAKECKDHCWGKLTVLVSERHAAWKGTDWCVTCTEKQGDKCAALDPAAHKKGQCFVTARAKCREAGYCKKGQLRNGPDLEEGEFLELDEGKCKKAKAAGNKVRGFVADKEVGGKLKGCVVAKAPAPKKKPVKVPKVKVPKVKIPKVKIPKIKAMKGVKVNSVTAHLHENKKVKLPKKKKFKPVKKAIKKAIKKANKRVAKPKPIKAKKAPKKPDHTAYWKRVIQRNRRRAAYYRKRWRRHRLFYYRRIRTYRRRAACIRRALRHRPTRVIVKRCNKPSCKKRGPRLHVGGGRRRHRRGGWMRDMIRGQRRARRARRRSAPRRFHPRGRRFSRNGKKKPSKLGTKKIQPGSIAFARFLSKTLVK